MSLLMALYPGAWVRVKSGVPQGTVLGPLLFLIYTNDIGSGISSTLKLFGDDCILYGVIDIPRDTEILQQDLNLITEWCKYWLMRLNVDKCINLQCYINPLIHFSWTILLKAIY